MSILLILSVTPVSAVEEVTVMVDKAGIVVAVEITNESAVVAFSRVGISDAVVPEPATTVPAELM